MSETSVNAYEIIRRLYEPGSPAHYYLVCHGEAVARKAAEIADRLDKPGIDRGLLYRGAMLHDIGMILTDVPECGGTGTKPYFYHGVLGGQYLRGIGLDTYARFAERHQWMGLTKEDIEMEGFDYPDGVYMPETLEERLVCFADCYFSKVSRWLTTPKPVEHIVSKLPGYQAERFLNTALEFGECTERECRNLLSAEGV